MTIGSREALMVLNLVPGLGTVRIQSLLEFFGTPEVALDAPAAVLEQVPRIGARMAAAIADWRNCTNLERELELADRMGVRILTLRDPDYPDALRRMQDPPMVLYVLGEVRQEDAERAVSIVGTRRATPYGMNAARRFGRELAEAGCTIISGLARGIDTAAHWGALDAGGRTIGVLGVGLADIYPPENRELAARIVDGHGAIVSEFPMYMRGSRTTFPQRNRIVAAWSHATFVAEAPSRSGALHTARLASEEAGKPVFVLPGPVDIPSYTGCHALIRDGAILCTRPAELLEDMHWRGEPRQLSLFGEEEPAPAEGPTPAAENPHPLTADDARLLIALAEGNDTADSLCATLGLSSVELAPLLIRMQVAGHLRLAPGGRYALVK